MIPASKKQRGSEAGPTPADLLNITRADLSEAQRFRSELQDQLGRITAEVESLRKKSTQQTRRITTLENERAQLHMRLRDRDAELKGKAKLLEVGGVLFLSRLPGHIQVGGGKWLTSFCFTSTGLPR